MSHTRPRRSMGRRARPSRLSFLGAALVAVTALGCTQPPAPGPGPTPTVAPTVAPGGGGTQRVTATIQVNGTLDGGGRRYVGAGALGGTSTAEGNPPMFVLANGATLSNVIIGRPAADGVHCTGSCTLRNIVWEDILDDAATFKGTSAGQTMVIDGGSARGASDKVFQHNGPGTMVIRNFAVQDFGKLYRSCGNCSRQFQRNVRIENVTATAPGKVLAGINVGDTVTFSNVTIRNDSGRRIIPCEQYRAVTSGSSPKLGPCSYPANQVVWR
jgi:pectate lyase